MHGISHYAPPGWRVDDGHAARIDAAAAQLEAHGIDAAPMALVLGSGLGDFLDQMDVVASVGFAEIPGVHAASVQGHSGRVARARLDGRDVIVLQGRLHAYEGIALPDVVLLLLALRALGVGTVVLTNAAGGLDPSMRAGDVAVLTGLVDLHLRDSLRGVLLPTDPARGEAQYRSRKAGRVFDPALARTIRELSPGVAHAGTYVSVWGPNYETPLEIGMMRLAGGVAVGMSTGPEAVALKTFGARVAGISLITNVSVEHGGGIVTHDEVVAVGASSADRMKELLARVIVNLSEPA